MSEEIVLTNDYGYIKGKDVFLKGVNGANDRKIGEVKTSPEDALAYFENRYALAVERVDQLEKDVEEAENKGAYLMKLIHLRKQMGEYDGLGDFEVLIKRLDAREVELQELIAKNKARNLEIKTEILDKFADLMSKAEEIELNELIEKGDAFRNAWIKVGGLPPEHQEKMSDHFDVLAKQLLDIKLAEREKRRARVGVRIDELNAANDRIVDLIRQKKFDQEAFAIYEEAVAVWKQDIDLPPTVEKALDAKLEKTTAKFEGYYKDAQVDITPWLTIIEEAEELKNHSDIRVAVARIKELQYEFKQVGLLPRSVKNKVLLRFWTACDTVLEIHFINGQCLRISKGYFRMTSGEQFEIRSKVLQDQIRRAKDDLQRAEENAGLFNAKTNQRTNQRIDHVLASKLDTMRRRIGIKEKLLRELEEKFGA